MNADAEPRGDAAGGTPSAAAGAGAEPSHRLGGWLKSKAATLQGHVRDMQENTRQIAKGFAKAQRANEERYDVTFTTRALGLELDLHDGALVRLIKPGGQAESLQVRTQDRLVAIAGEPLPFADDVDGFVEAMRQRMSQLPRPVTLTFARVVAPPPGAAAEAGGGVAAGPEDGGSEPLVDMVKQRMPKLPRSAGLPFGRSEEPVPGLQAELAAAREALQRSEAEVAAARAEVATAKQDAKQANGDAIAAVEEAAALRADLADLQLSKVWSAQEAQTSAADAEAARADAAEARQAVSRLEAEVERLRSEGAAAEEALAVERSAAAEQRTELEGLRERVTGADARATELAAARQDLQEQLEELRQQLVREQAAREADASQEASARGDLEERLRAAEQLRDEALGRARDLEARRAAAEERLSATASEVEALQAHLQRREAGATASERLIAELRHEVESLYGEVQEHEQRAAAALDEASELREELERVRASGGGAASGPDTATEATALLGAAEPEPALIGKAAVYGNAGSSAGASPTAAEEARFAQLEARVLELQAENATLTRQLSSRPIVYQFGPLPGDEAEQGAAYEDDEETVVASGEGGGPRLRVLLYAGAIWCRRRTLRGIASCRKQRLAQSLERSLRAFTRSLLQRPLLLWLFYAHVLALWVIEFYRQAVSQPLETIDPSSKLQRMVDKAATSGPRA
mmetsp:Transcript_136794/g.381322  ORF Transcript_136794/g.381322 Transcript_136794/m.381322 type:complete len:698 (+) Transcript_136794:91-2184(+)